MTKLLQNKSIIKFLGIALSILLVVALIPQIGIAYGSKDDVVDETALAETGENAATEGEEVATDGEEAATSEEGDKAIEGDVVTIDGVEMVSHKVEVPGDDSDDNGNAATQSDEGIAVAAEETDEKTTTRSEKSLVGNSEQKIKAGEEVTNTSSPLTFSGNKTYTLTVNGTLKSDILITGGAKVTINGTGTIEGTHTSSVITVGGAGSELILGGEDDKGAVTGPTVTNGWGSESPNDYNGGVGTVGGGVFVKDNASFVLNEGKVIKNKAGAGGGVFIWTNCGFTMNGGKISHNETIDPDGDGPALAHEGGGIFTNGKKSHIISGEITHNTAATTTDWGGGGIYVNNDGSLLIDTARVTNNTANGLGGGIAGCPHAKIAIGKGIGEVKSSVAVFGNNVEGKVFPNNTVLRFNAPKSVEKSWMKAPSGDFLVTGVNEENDIPALGSGVNGGNVVNGKITYKTWDNPRQTYTLENGSYAKDEFNKDLAQDYYCTLASYISATNLKDNASGVAWKGCIVSLPLTTVGADNQGTVNQTGLSYQEYDFPAEKAIEVHDATLCLTSTATSDIPEAIRSVVIEYNTSGTHGGGISCNGTLEFGTFSTREKTVMPYNLKLKKKIVNSLNDEVKPEPNEFEFTLTEMLEGGKTGNSYTATNDKDGQIEFKDLPGFDTPGEKIVTYKLTEKELTDDQKNDGFEPNNLHKGIEITVKLNVVKTEVTHANSSSNRTFETYTTKDAKVVEIGGQKVEDIEAVVTNTLNLKAKESVSVTKVADGIAAGSFAFRFKKIDNIGEVVNDQSNPTALKQANSLVSIAAAEGAIVKPIEWQSDEPSTRKTGVVSFDTEEYTTPGTYWYAIAEQNGGTQDVANGVDYDGTTYLVKVDVTLSENKRSLETNPTIYKAATGATALEDATEIGVKFENVAMEYAEFNLGLTKQILTTLGAPLPLNDRKFSFALYEGENPIAEANPVAQGTTDRTTGKLNLLITDDKYAKEAFGEAAHKKTFTFTLKETVPEGIDGSYVTTIPDATVEVELSAAGERTEVDGHTMFLVTPTVESVKVNGTDVEVEDKAITVTNRYAPHGEWQFQVDKYFYGLGDPRDCSFTMQEIERAPQAGEPLANVLVANDNLQKWTASATAAAFQNNKAVVVFGPIKYQVTAPKADAEADQNIPTAEDARGDHYYLITEDGDDAAKDTTAYVVKVTVAVDKNDPGKLVATETVRGYADDLNSALNPMPKGERPAFYNTDTQHMISAASYSVYAASGEPVDQVCYVDPKIVKNLEGRAIKSGEFAFKLIQVANYNDTEGELISATTNDEFGMVDFDKANNVSGDLENPSCLAYTKPGTYYYRVIEDTSKGGMNDQSVLYSDQVITFTTVIKQDEKTGQLVCTDMYYGWWDAAANQNVRFDEQYADYETQPGNIGDMSKLNPDWHPTINNKARPMDLQVRKTSVSDRDEGLVGATYALYMVNENPQGDIWLAEATSEEGGWITYKNVSLATNNLYYFKETAAPAGHTVSEFRSPYFYLVEDATSANGYALKYADTKYFDAAETEAAAAPLAAAEAQALQAAIAAQAEATAADDQTKPGHSADGNILLTYDKDGGVYDETTQIEVNKLDTRTHEWVEGAKLVILDKESGKEVASWTSGKAPQKLAKTLNVGTTYLLREVEAPGEYRLANDVEFVIDNYGNVTITKGTENGNAELSDNTITLYDTMMDAEEVEQREHETTREVPLGTILAQTGDMLPILGIGLIVLASLIALIVAGRRRRAGKDDEN